MMALQNQEIKKKRKEKENHLFFHFYYKFIFWILGKLCICCRGGHFGLLLRILFRRYGKGYQYQLHTLKSFFFLGGISWSRKRYIRTLDSFYIDLPYL